MESYKKIIGILFLGCAAGNIQSFQHLARLARPAATAVRQALQAKPTIRPLNPIAQPQIKTVHTHPSSFAPLVTAQKNGQEQKKSWNKKWAALGATCAATAYALQKDPVLCEGAKAPIDIETFDYASLEDMDDWRLNELIESIPTYLFIEYNPRTDFCKKALDFYIDNNKIEKLAYLILGELFKQLPDTQKQECFLKIINSFIDNNKIEKLDPSVLVSLFKQLSNTQKQEYSFKIINSFIDNNKIEKLLQDSIDYGWIFGSLFYQLTDTQKQDTSLKIINSFIKNNKIEELGCSTLDSLFEQLSDTQKQDSFLKIINSFIDNNKIEKLDNQIFFKLFYQLTDTQTQDYYSLKIINSFIDNNKIEESSYWMLYRLFTLHLLDAQKQEYSLKIINYFIDNNKIEKFKFYFLLEHTPTDYLNNLPFTLATLMNASHQTCPTILHAKKNYSSIVAASEEFIQIPEIKELCIEMIDYSAEQQEKGYVTLLHGQAWEWSFYETLYRKLEQQKGKDVCNDFMYFRYDKNYLISEEKATALAKTGVKYYYTQELFGILFTNLFFIANHEGSNSVIYVAKNYDQSTSHNLNSQEILNLFKDSGLYKAAQKVHYSHKALFDRAQDLHKKASLYGNFVTVSIPKDLVNTLVYPTESGGPRIKYTLTNGTKTDDVLYMAEHADLLPFDTEFGIVLGPKMTDPEKAKKAGIEIKQWNAADPEIITQRDAIIDEIIQLVIQEAEKNK
ncbi:hypothetical protein K9K77_03330 [Candidatus Babeliales bacterium]|nr:hypothetical protein [Candidatus Babeliales bacterium]